MAGKRSIQIWGKYFKYLQTGNKPNSRLKHIKFLASEIIQWMIFTIAGP